MNIFGPVLLKRNNVFLLDDIKFTYKLILS